jgi:hypothetical protein
MSPRCHLSRQSFHCGLERKTSIIFRDLVVEPNAFHGTPALKCKSDLLATVIMVEYGNQEALDLPNLGLALKLVAILAAGRLMAEKPSLEHRAAYE